MWSQSESPENGSRSSEIHRAHLYDFPMFTWGSLREKHRCASSSVGSHLSVKLSNICQSYLNAKMIEWFGISWSATIFNLGSLPAQSIDGTKLRYYHQYAVLKQPYWRCETCIVGSWRMTPSSE
jgi:hypothetical protein